MIQSLISELVEYGIEQGLVPASDEVYVTNRLMELLECEAYEKREPGSKIRPIHEILEDILAYAIEKEILKEFEKSFTLVLNTISTVETIYEYEKR